MEIITCRDERFYDLEDLPGEEWKPIPGFEKLYRSSNYGRVVSIKAGIVMKPAFVGPKRQYNSIPLYKDGHYKHILSHRIVAISFIPNPERKATVNHKDGNEINNHVSNLEWATHSENHKHAFAVLGRKPNKTGLGKKGKLHPNTKPVYQYTLDGEFVGQYHGVLEAVRATGVAESSIHGSISGRYSHGGGYLWLRKKLDG